MGLTITAVLSDLAVDALAAHRLVRLAQRDTLPVIARWRGGVLSSHPEHPLSELLTCPWCLSIHVAAAVVAARWMAPRWWAPIARVLAMSSAVGLISEWES